MWSQTYTRLLSFSQPEVGLKYTVKYTVKYNWTKYNAILFNTIKHKPTKDHNESN